MNQKTVAYEREVYDRSRMLADSCGIYSASRGNTERGGNEIKAQIKTGNQSRSGMIPGRLPSNRKPKLLSVPRKAPVEQLPDTPLENFEAALIKARDAWQSKGATTPRLGQTGTYSVRAPQHSKNSLIEIAEIAGDLPASRPLLVCAEWTSRRSDFRRVARTHRQQKG